MEPQNTNDAQQMSQAMPGDRVVSQAYSWADDDQMQQQYQYQLYEGREQQQQQQQQMEPSQPVHSQMAEGEVRKEMAHERQQQQQQQQQQKIEVDEQQLANALLETLQKLTRPQPTAAGAAAIAPPPPPPPPPSESYFTRTPSTLVAPRTPRTPVAARQIRYLSTVSNGTVFKTSPQAFMPTDGLQYASRPHTRTYSEKSFATR